MARVAPRVHIDAADIARLQHIAQQLPQDERVQIVLESGDILRGTVEQQPGMQAFFDPHGLEGTNALLRLDAFLDDGRPHPGGSRDIWLDDIRAVTRLSNPSPPEPSSAWPTDPNAPTVD